MPAVAVTSLMTTGRPCSSPGASPRMIAPSAARAASLAAWGTSVTTAVSCGCLRARIQSARLSLAQQVDEGALDHQEQEIDRVAERAGRENGRVHVRHVEK